MTSDRNDSIKILNHWDSFLPDISASFSKSNYAKLLAEIIILLYVLCYFVHVSWSVEKTCVNVLYKTD